MPVSEQELERIADEMYLQRRILTSTYCGRCGYNLKSLPILYVCPECGNEYNARPLKMKGIFLPNAAEFPFGDIVASGFCLLMTVLITVRGLTPLNPDMLLLALGFLAMTMWLVIKSAGMLATYVKAIKIAKRIDEDEDD